MKLAQQINFKLFAQRRDNPIFDGFKVFGLTKDTDLWPNAKPLKQGEQERLDLFRELYGEHPPICTPADSSKEPDPFEDEDLIRKGWEYWSPRLGASKLIKFDPEKEELNEAGKQDLISFGFYSGFKWDVHKKAFRKIRLIIND